jgi:hypothetical protein
VHGRFGESLFRVPSHPSSQRVPRSVSVYEAGTVRNMALRCQPLCARGPCPVPHIWCADALVAWVDYGTVRLHVHVRGRDVVLDRPQYRQRRFLSMSLSSCKRESDSIHRVNSPAVSTFNLIRVWLRHSLQIFTVSFFNCTWAQCILLLPLRCRALDLGRLAAHSWPTLYLPLIYFPNTGILTYPQVLPPIVITFKIRWFVHDMVVGP